LLLPVARLADRARSRVRSPGEWRSRRSVKITRARTWLAGVLRADSVGIKIDVWQSAELSGPQEHVAGGGQGLLHAGPRATGSHGSWLDRDAGGP
jgi:hypothetical protein